MIPFTVPPLLFITGKGGTGKTTLTAALALQLAARKRTVGIVELGRMHIPALLGLRRSTYAGTKTRRGLVLHNLTPREAFAEYAIKRLGSATLYRTIFDNRFVHYFLDATPGLNELVCLGKIWELVTARTYDHLLVDLHATGHGLSFLDVPRILTDAIHRGPLYEHGLAMRTLLRDPVQTAVCIAALAEELPAAEALHIRQATAALQIRCCGVMVNRLLPDPLPPPLPADFSACAATYPHHPYVDATAYLHAHYLAQQQIIRELRSEFAEACRLAPAVTTTAPDVLLTALQRTMRTWEIA